jgi:hypothetical protein
VPGKRLVRPKQFASRRSVPNVDDIFTLLNSWYKVTNGALEKPCTTETLCVHNIGPNVFFGKRICSCYAEAESEKIVARLPEVRVRYSIDPDEARVAYCELCGTLITGAVCEAGTAYDYHYLCAARKLHMDAEQGHERRQRRRSHAGCWEEMQRERRRRRHERIHRSMDSVRISLPGHQERDLRTGERPSEAWSAARVAWHWLRMSTSRCREAAGTCWSMAKVATRHLCGRFVGFGMSWYVSVRSSLEYLWRRDIKMPIRQLSRAPEREGARKGQRARRRVRGTCVSGAGMARVAAARRDAPLASWAAVRRQRSAWLWGRRSPRLAAATTTVLRALRCCRRLGVDRRTSPSVQASPGATLRVAFERQGT